MVVSVGINSQATLEKMQTVWASQIDGEPMAISVADNRRLAQLAYAIHKGRNL